MKKVIRAVRVEKTDSGWKTTFYRTYENTKENATAKEYKERATDPASRILKAGFVPFFASTKSPVIFIPSSEQA